jgi:hypothetical protein
VEFAAMGKRRVFLAIGMRQDGVLTALPAWSTRPENIGQLCDEHCKSWHAQAFAGGSASHPTPGDCLGNRCLAARIDVCPADLSSVGTGRHRRHPPAIVQGTLRILIPEHCRFKDVLREHTSRRRRAGEPEAALLVTLVLTGPKNSKSSDKVARDLASILVTQTARTGRARAAQARLWRLPVRR